MTYRLLITQINRPPGYSVALALRRAGWVDRVVATSVIPPSVFVRGSRAFEAVLHLPIPKPVGDESLDAACRRYVDAVLDICRRYDLNAIWPCNDEEIRAVAMHRDVLTASGITCFVNDYTVASRALDKFQVSGLAHEVGFPAPASVELSALEGGDELAGITFPMIIKADSSSGATGVLKVWNEQERNAAIAHLLDMHGAVHVEEYVRGDEEISINAVRYADGRLACCFGLRKFRYIHPSWSTSCQVIELSSKVIADTKRLLDGLGVVGAIAIQTKTDAVTGEYKLIEVNQRFGGISRVLIPMIPGLCEAAAVALEGKSGPAVEVPYGRYGASIGDDVIAFFVFIAYKIRGRSGLDNKPPSFAAMLRSYYRTYRNRPALDDYTKAALSDPLFYIGFMGLIVRLEWRLPKSWASLIPWGAAR